MVDALFGALVLVLSGTLTRFHHPAVIISGHLSEISKWL